MAHSAEESEIISEEIVKLLKKGAIKECDREKGDFISTVFTRKKKDSGMHNILNLKQLNKHVTYQHFKMESWSDACKIIQPNCWMASVDLKDAFYTIPRPFQERRAIAHAHAHTCAKVFRHVINRMRKSNLTKCFCYIIACV